MNYLLRTSFRRAMYNKTTHRDSLPSRIWKCVTGLLQWPPLPPPLSPHLVPTAPKRTQWAWDVVKWDWRRVAESGRITGVCRQTADRERNWVRERPPRGRSSTSRQMHCQRFAYSTIAVMLSSPWPNIRDKTLDEWKKKEKTEDWGASALFVRLFLCASRPSSLVLQLNHCMRASKPPASLIILQNTQSGRLQFS